MSSITTSGGLNFTYPAENTNNWFTIMAAGFNTISSHDHSGGGKGLAIGTSGIASNAITGAKILLANNTSLNWNNASSSQTSVITFNASNQIDFNQQISTATMVNNVYFTSENAAGNGTVNLLKADASNNATIGTNTLILGTVGIGTSATPSSTVITDIRSDQNADSMVRVRNSTAGTGSSARFIATSDGGTAYFAALSSTNTEFSGIAGNSLLITADTSFQNIYIASAHATGQLFFNTGNAERVRITNSGLSFNAGTNFLNVYVDGTFTPVAVGATSAGTGTYSFQLGRYQKIGPRVHLDYNIAWTAHTGTGTVRHSGLPFTIKSLANYQPGMAGLKLHSDGSFIATVFLGLTNTTYLQSALTGTSAYESVINGNETYLFQFTYDV